MKITKLIHHCVYVIFSVNVRTNQLILLARQNRFATQLLKGFEKYSQNMLSLSNKRFNILEILANWQIKYTRIALVMAMSNRTMVINTLVEAIYNSQGGTTIQNFQISWAIKILWKTPNWWQKNML